MDRVMQATALIQAMMPGVAAGVPWYHFVSVFTDVWFAPLVERTSFLFFIVKPIFVKDFGGVILNAVLHVQIKENYEEEVYFWMWYQNKPSNHIGEKAKWAGGGTTACVVQWTPSWRHVRPGCLLVPSSPHCLRVLSLRLASRALSCKQSFSRLSTLTSHQSTLLQQVRGWNFSPSIVITKQPRAPDGYRSQVLQVLWESSSSWTFLRPFWLCTLPVYHRKLLTTLVF